VRPFNLLRYFALASLAVIAVLALATAAIFSHNLQRQLTEEAGLYAADMSAVLERAIFFEYLLPRMRAGESIDLEDPEQRARLDEVVVRSTRGFRILTVNLFRRDGTIEYSTNPGYIGYRSIDNPGIEHVLAEGETISFLKRAELEVHPIRPGHDLLESYTPFHELDPDSLERGSVIGVIELYQDARPITAKIAEGRRQILLSTAAIMGLLFAALFAIVRVGHQRIAELTAALENSNHELERQIARSANLASLGELAAGIAHEIRNPVGMIASAAQLLGRGEHAERDRKLVSAISSEAARIGRTIGEFVSFAAPPEPSRTATEPAALLLRTREMLAPEAARRGVELVLEGAAGAPKILVDPEMLYRALTNLVLNALQVQPSGGRVELAARRAPAGEVSIHVRDHGPGIDPADLERIFQPFFTRRPEGTGLGLSIVQRIVAANGGRISVASDARGTEFSLYFAEAGT
jgi:signal transduction histidine kinase